MRQEKKDAMKLYKNQAIECISYKTGQKDVIQNHPGIRAFEIIKQRVSCLSV
jgi:hypothetical protein